MKYASLRQGLVGAWCPSLGPSGNTLLDRSGYGNHGTLTNMDAGTDWVGSRYGWALDFDGTNDYVGFLPLAPALGFSFSAWFRAASTSRALHSVFANSTDYSPDIYLHLERVATDTYAMNFYDGGRYLGASSSFTLNTDWHHYAWTTSLSGTITYYRDGISMGTASTWSPVNDNATTATLGGIIALLGSGFAAQGQLDDCRRSLRPWTPAEIRLLASEPGISLKPERTSVFFGADLFSAAWLSRQSSIIGGGVA